MMKNVSGIISTSILNNVPAMLATSGYVTSHRRADMNILTEIDKAYIAGFFDGEGCVVISKSHGKESRTPRYALVVVVSQKGIVPLGDLCNMTGVGKIYISNKAANAHSWTISNSHAKEFLAAILPYLRVKKQQAALAIEFAEKFNRQTRVYARGRKAVGGSMPIPQYIVDEKERYRLLLHEMKNGGPRSFGRKKNNHANNL
jgi:hypothetical protein